MAAARGALVGKESTPLVCEKKDHSGPDKRWVQEIVAQNKIAARKKLLKAVPRLARKTRTRAN